MISPSEGPFHFYTWLELPFPVVVKVVEEFIVDYQSNCEAKLKLVIKSNVYRIVTGNRWHDDQEFEKWFTRVTAGEKDLPPPLLKTLHLYIAEDEIVDCVTELKSRKEVMYVHIEEVPAVVDLSLIIPESAVPKREFEPFDLMPSVSFFNEQVLPHLQSIIDAYRIASLPFMRYTILPVSESLVDTAYVLLTNNKGEPIAIHELGFDVRGSSKIKRILYNFAERLDFQSRFDYIFPRLSELEAEDRMTSAYYLYHMRRWTEAIAVASSVVDGLLRKLVSRLASTEIEAQAILRAYRYKELFNTVFPAFGKPKLAKMSPKLWQLFVKAMEYRGAKVHGDHSKAFDDEQAKTVKQYLQAFNNVAQWLNQQMGIPWELDFYEGSNLLEPFP